jgi:hypothetical protein
MACHGGGHVFIPTVGNFSMAALRRWRHLKEGPRMLFVSDLRIICNNILLSIKYFYNVGNSNSAARRARFLTP